MPAGVEGFVASRLKIAREAKGMKQYELASAVGKSEATISKYENAEKPQRPDASVIPLLSEALDIHNSWLFKPMKLDFTRAAFNRSLKSELATKRDRVRAYLFYVEEIVDTLERYIDFPELDIPDVMRGRDFRKLTAADIEDIALELRSYWDLGEGPIFDMMTIVENAGIFVSQCHVGSEKLDGASWWNEETERPYMLLAADKYNCVRRRFDVAHELGHIILHRHINAKDLVSNFAQIEKQAMHFASAFLMPASEFEQDVFSFSLDALLSLKSKWKVSIAAMIMRLRYTEAISEDYTRRLFQYYSYRKWRGREPLDDELEVEMPKNLSDAVKIILESNFCSFTQLCRQIGLSENYVAELCHVEDAAWTKTSQVIRFEPSARSRNPSASESGVVLPMMKPGGKR